MTWYRPPKNAIRVPPGAFYFMPIPLGPELPIRSSKKSHATFDRMETVYPSYVLRVDWVKRGRMAGDVYITRLARSR